VDRRSISGLRVSKIVIKDSISDGFSVVSPGKKGQVTLSDVLLEKLTIPNCGIGTEGRHGIWVRADALGSMGIADSKIVDIKIDSVDFFLTKNPEGFEQFDIKPMAASMPKRVLVAGYRRKMTYKPA